MGPNGVSVGQVADDEFIGDIVDVDVGHIAELVSVDDAQSLAGREIRRRHRVMKKILKQPFF